MRLSRFFCTSSSIETLVVLLLASGIGIASAQEVVLSPAEQAALAAQNPVDEAYLINLCHHALLYGSEQDKAAALEKLGDQTCAEAVASGASGADSEPSQPE